MSQISRFPAASFNEASIPAPAFRPAGPIHMVWLATAACNLRCVHCSTAATKRRPGELSTAEAFDLFEQFAGMGVFDVAVSGGEPLARRDIFDVLAHATALGIRTGLGSNGSTVTPAVARRLHQAGLHRLQISIDGLEATHDCARRLPGLFHVSAAAIARGLDAGLRVHVCFTAHRLNYHELEAVIDQCIAWGVQRFNLSRLVPMGRGCPDLDLTPAEWKEVVTGFEAKRRAVADKIEFSTHLAQLILVDPTLACIPGFAGCQAGRAQGCIGAEGEVMPCVLLPVVIGNVREQSLADIWHESSVIRSLQDRSLLGGACGTCTYREKCGGCRGVAFAYTGDHLAADPRCWLRDSSVNSPNNKGGPSSWHSQPQPTLGLKASPNGILA
jgi:radical SAM protein with 4Fe4S-binding SPASM domain